MKCLINVSTLRAGGGFQVGVNVLKSCLYYKDEDIVFFYLINSNFSNKIIKLPNDNTFIVEDYPSNIFNLGNKKNIYKHIRKINPDIIYSVGSPSYLNLKNQIEVMRLTNPWIIYKNQIAFGKINVISRIKLKFEIFFKKQFLKKSKYFITQTEDSKINISKNLSKSKENIFVIPNVYSYNLEKYKNIDINRNYTGVINILIFSANYFHKNIDISIQIAKELKDRNIDNIRFILTIPHNQFLEFENKINKLCLTKYFINRGKIDIKDIPQLYIDSHILFLPTLLEVFSVTFLEAMIFNLPIVTTDLSFNKDVCQEAALYFNDYFKGSDVAELFMNIINNSKLREDLINNGKRIINNHDNNLNIYNKHIKILKMIKETEL